MFTLLELECMYFALVLRAFEEFIRWTTYKFEENRFAFHRVFKSRFNTAYNHNIGISKAPKCKLYLYFLEHINLQEFKVRVNL